MITEIIKINYPEVTLKRGENENVYEVESHVGENFIKLGKAEVNFNHTTKKISFIDMVKSSDKPKSDGKKHIVNISGKDFMTYEGLLEKAHERNGVFNMVITESWVSEDMTRAWCKVRLSSKVEARDSKTKKITQTSEQTFDGFGSSTPDNTGKMTQTHPVEMAHTRAKGRALRDYLNIGQVMAEEMKQE